MRKQTVVISINTDILTNFLHLPPRFEVQSKIGKQNVVYDVMVHNEPRYQMGPKGIEANFDLFINNQAQLSPDWTDWKQLLPADMIHVHERFPKHAQAMRLLGAQLPEGTKFRAVRTWAASVVGTAAPNSYSFGHDAHGSVVIKPRDGARGIGHFVVDLDQISLGQLFNDIRSEDVTATAIEEKYTPHVTYHKGMEHTEDEGIKMLRTQGAVMQEVVNNIAMEYRVLVDHNSEIFLVLPRERINRAAGEKAEISYPNTGVDSITTKPQVHGTDYHQGTGSSCKVTKGFEGTPLLEVFGGDELQAEAFRSLVKQVIPAMNSLDLFVCYDGSWGIFEYSNQFGTAGVPLDKAHELHYNYIKHILDLKFNK